MERDDRSDTETHDQDNELKRNEALARYDAHPGIAVMLLAVAAFLLIVVVYQFASDRTNNAALSIRHSQAVRSHNPLVGLSVLSSDGNKVGTVDSVDGEPDGNITAINITMGGFLGLGVKLVAIPEGKFRRIGDNVRLGMTADEARKMPELKPH
jgi:sporulation protein YlmC with PRC-barrel domain